MVSLKNMTIAQHHDAVDGAAKQHFFDDYTLRLNQGIMGCFNIVFGGFGSSGKQDMSWFIKCLQL